MKDWQWYLLKMKLQNIRYDYVDKHFRIFENLGHFPSLKYSKCYSLSALYVVLML